MATPESDELASLLAAVQAGDAGAKDRLFRLVYDDLRRISGRLMRHERPDHTLQPTAVVHEAFLKLFQGNMPGVADRRFFFGAATRAMRQVLIDHAAARDAAKRGGGFDRVPLDDVLDSLEARRIDLLDLRDALDELEALDDRQAQVVTLRFLYRCTTPEVARQLDVSESTVENDWRLARSWLFERLQGGGV
jgi:RNA polymerase sigma factor (TIGR02999 family)